MGSEKSDWSDTNLPIARSARLQPTLNVLERLGHDCLLHVLVLNPSEHLVDDRLHGILLLLLTDRRLVTDPTIQKVASLVGNGNGLLELVDFGFHLGDFTGHFVEVFGDVDNVAELVDVVDALLDDGLVVFAGLGQDGANTLFTSGTRVPNRDEISLVYPISYQSSSPLARTHLLLLVEKVLCHVLGGRVPNSKGTNHAKTLQSLGLNDVNLLGNSVRSETSESGDERGLLDDVLSWGEVDEVHCLVPRVRARGGLVAHGDDRAGCG